MKKLPDITDPNIVPVKHYKINETELLSIEDFKLALTGKLKPKSKRSQAEGGDNAEHWVEALNGSKKKPKRKLQPEYILHKSICQYLRTQYPDIFFLTDSVAAVKLTIQQATRNKVLQCNSFHSPDLIIFAKRGNFGSLFIELKTSTPFKADGTTKASQNDHLLKQHETIKKLNSIGFLACFCWSFDDAVKLIDDYLKLK